MKNNRFFAVPLVLACLLVVNTTIVSATTTATATDEVATSSVVSTEPASTPGEVRTTLPRTAQMRIMNLAANISNRFDASVRRLTNIQTRLESRAAKLDSEGLNTAPAREKLAEATSHIDEAAKDLATIDTAVALFVGSETPRDRWQILKETYRGIAEEIKLSHQATVEALLLLRSATTVSPTTNDSPEEATDVQ
ncbi:MAG: hypothetical protein RLZZ70_666 [Candidatus Parcubacteria bacterium]|jgi:hypothetical protein